MYVSIHLKAGSEAEVDLRILNGVRCGSMEVKRAVTSNETIISGSYFPDTLWIEVSKVLLSSLAVLCIGVAGIHTVG